MLHEKIYSTFMLFERFVICNCNVEVRKIGDKLMSILLGG